MSVDTYNITEIQCLNNRDPRLFVDKPAYDRKCDELQDLRTQIERAFQMLEIHGVPRDRAKYASTGIDVLATRLSRENADLRARCEKAEKDAERYRWLVANSFDREGVTQIHVWEHSWCPHSKTGESTEWKGRIRGTIIDSTIDAAIAKWRTC